MAVFKQRFLRRGIRVGREHSIEKSLHYMQRLRSWAGLWPDTLHFSEAQNRQDDRWLRLSRASALTEYELPVIRRERVRGISG